MSTNEKSKTYTIDNRIIAFALFFSLALINLYDNLILGPYGLVDYNDCFGAEMFYHKIKGVLLNTYGFFSWFPWYSGGIPTYVSHHQPYYPVSLIAPWVPGWFTFLIWKTTQLTIAGYGMNRLLRNWFGLSAATAFVGAFVFALLQRNITFHYVFAYAFPIFFLWSQELLECELSRLGRIIRVLGMLFWAALSYPVLTLPYFSTLHIAFILVFARGRGRLGARILQAVVIWTGCILLFSPNLTAYYSYLSFHHRIFHDSYTTFKDALNIAWGSLRGTIGLLPATSIVLCCLPEIRRSPRLFWASVYLVSTLVISATFFSPFKYVGIFYYLRFFDLFNLQSMHPMAFAMCAAFGFEQLRKAPRFPSLLRIALCVVPLTILFSSHVVMIQALSLAAFLGFLLLVRHCEGRDRLSSKNTVAALCFFLIGICGVWMISRQRVLQEGRVPYIKAYEHDPGLLRISAEMRDNPNMPFRVANLDVQCSIAKSYVLDTVDNYNVLFDKHFHKYVEKIVEPQFRTDEMRERFQLEHTLLYLTAVDPKTFRTEDLRWEYWRERNASEWRLNMLAAMNVKYLVASQPIVGIEQYADLITSGSKRHVPWNILNIKVIDEFYSLPLWVYQLRHRQELGFFALKVHSFPDEDALLSAMGSANPAELSTTAYVLDSDNLVAAGSDSSPSAVYQSKLTSWSPDRIRFSLVTTGAAVFVVSNNFHPGWQASLDGKTVTVNRANGAF